MNARSTTLFLYLIAKMKPQLWDAIHPDGPQVSVASREYLIAMSTKGFASELDQQAVGSKLAAVQKTLVQFAGQRIAADYDDDNWCPTGKRPIPGPRPFESAVDEVMLNPQPLPPKALQREIGGYLLMLSEATSHEGAAKELRNIGSSLLR